MIELNTPHLNLPLPHPDNDLEDDVPRLIAALEAVDSAVHGVQQQVAGKADAAGTALALQALDESVQDLQANKADAASVSAALGGKADKATTLAGYGINDGVKKSGDTLTGLLATATSTAGVGANGSTGSWEVRGSATAGAVMSFHRSGVYAINFGLDTDNVFRLGGWSQGTNAYRWTSDASGNFTATGNVTAYSDMRLKSDLAAIPDALDKVQALTGYTYTRKDTGARQTGLIAQDVQRVLPEAVMDDGEHLSLAYGNLVGLLVQAIKELRAEVQALKGRP